MLDNKIYKCSIQLSFFSSIGQDKSKLQKQIKKVNYLNWNLTQ